MNSPIDLVTIWHVAPLALAGWLICTGNVERDHGGLARRLFLRDRGRQLQGVCRGTAEYFDVSVWLVRALALAVIATNCWGALAYVLVGVAVPWHPDDTKTWARTRMRRWLSGHELEAT